MSPSSPNPAGSITPDPLTPQREAEIRELYRTSQTTTPATVVVPELLAEVDRLRETNRQWSVAAEAAAELLQQQIDEQAKEIDRLREDNKRLRQSLANGEKVVTARDAQLSTFRHLAAEHLYRSTEAAAELDRVSAEDGAR